MPILLNKNIQSKYLMNMSDGFHLLKSTQINGNLAEVNLGMTVNDTVIINSNNNIQQNSIVNNQFNNIQNTNQNNQNIINSQVNNNQDIKDYNIGNGLYEIYVNENEKIEYIKDENNNIIYDVDMNNETEYSFQEKLKKIEEYKQNKLNINAIPIVSSIDINEQPPQQKLQELKEQLQPPQQQEPSQSLIPNSNYTLPGINQEKINNTNAENTENNNLIFIDNKTKLHTKIYSKTEFGNPFEKSNLINNFKSNKQNQKNIVNIVKLIDNPTTESHIEQNIINNNKNNEFYINNSIMRNNPTIKSIHE